MGWLSRVRFLVLVVFAMALAARAGPVGANVCDDAARDASERSGVPLDVLRAITRAETAKGKARAPWPWTINANGRGRWFDTRRGARQFALSQVRGGTTNIDLGCFQINYRWHGRSFETLSDMLDPTANALYAATFLKSLYREFGNWEDAAGAFHSRTPARNAIYRARVANIRRKLKPEAQPRPLLPTSRAGSLFHSDGEEVTPLLLLN